VQRGADFAALAGALAMQERHGDGGEQVHAGHEVALAGQRKGWRSVCVAEPIEQARAGEERR
jgi:hypothetical protein